MLDYLNLPEQYDHHIVEARNAKEAAIDAKDFDKAKYNRDREKTLVRDKVRLIQTIKEVGKHVFERFTDRARRVVVLAQEEARMLNHNYIGTEHVLLGLIHEGEGVAARVLVGLGVSLESVRSSIETIIGQGQEAPSGHIPFTPRGKKVLELSLREALQLGHNYIGTEHILLGVIREGEGVGCQVLAARGVELTRVRQAIIETLTGIGIASEPLAGPDSPESTWKARERVRGNKIADEAREAAERERLRATYVEPEPDVEGLTERAQSTFDVLSKAWVLIAILNDHGIEPNPTLVTQLIEWKASTNGD